MKILRITTALALFLACCVVMFGAYTRLTDAGLGCPDWPGCYGRIVLPSSKQALSQAQHIYPTVPIESRKAWTEMIHRYAAGTLVLLILAVVIHAGILRYRGLRLSMLFPTILFLLIGFQAVLGMWTVTLKLLPVVVMGHLLGGMLIAACLCAFLCQINRLNGKIKRDLGGEVVRQKQAIMHTSSWQPWICLGIIIVICQIALGGWVSTNYAGVACVGFPRCNGQWLPALNLQSAFHVAWTMSTHYQGGILDHTSRVSIQLVHRLGAVVTMVYLFILMATIAWHHTLRRTRIVAGLVVVLLFTQVVLGIINVLYLLPLPAAVAHNGVAVFLLIALIYLHHQVLTEKKFVA